MKISVHPNSAEANQAATDCLERWLTQPGTRNVMVAGGNTPLTLYESMAKRRRNLSHLNVFALDEYVGVPENDPRTCGNLLRATVAEAWGVPSSQYFVISPVKTEALESVRRHEQKISEMGGIDVIILGLGQNGHLGFNEPGSEVDSIGRLIELDGVSIEANRKWFDGDYAPDVGITVGVKTILSARHVLIMAYGTHKTAPVAAMVQGPRSRECPASFLQGHADTHLFLDVAAARLLTVKA